MAKQRSEESRRATEMRRTIEPQLREAGVAIGELNEIAAQYISGELLIAQTAIDVIEKLVADTIWNAMAAAAEPADAIAERAAMHMASEVAAVAESAECISFECGRPDLMDSSGLIHGTDTRSPDDRAADPLSAGSCPIPPRSSPSTPPAVPSTPPASPTTPPPPPYQPVQPPPPSTPPNISSRFAQVAGCEVDRYGEEIAKSLLETAFGGTSSGGVLGFVGAAFDFLMSPISSTLKETIGAAVGVVISALGAFVDQVAKQAQSGIQGAGCDSAEMGSIVAAESAIKFVNLLNGVVPPQIWQPLEYRRNMICPVEFPSANEALQCFLGGTIEEKTFQTWLQQNNKCFEPQERLLRAARSRANATELAVQRLRKIIGKSEYDREMRNLGFLFQGEVDNLFKLTQQIPPISDLIRFMQRDAADDVGPDSVVQRFDLDAEFPSKWQGRLKEWGEMQGVPEDYAKYAWRAHWNIPAPGQLFTMYHRLRYNPQFGGQQKVYDDVVAALKQQDILPRWIPYYLAISFRPLTRVDVRRAYDVGALSIDSVKTSYLDLGYSDENAEALTKFTEKDRNRKIHGHRAIKLWKAELQDRYETLAQLRADNYPGEVIDKALDVAAKQQRNHSAVKKYAKGWIKRQDAGVLLSAHGIPNDISKPWLDDASQSYRTSPAVKQFAANIVTRETAEARLTEWGVPAEMFKVWLDDAALQKANHPAWAAYKKGVINNNTLKARLQRDDVPAATIDRMILWADEETSADAFFACAEALIKRFLRGEFGDVQLQQNLRAIPIPEEHVVAMAERAKCQLAAIGKDPGTAELCNWLDQGLIQPPQFIARLERLGWTNADAMNILTTCLTRIGNARAKQAAALAKQEAAAVAKAMRDTQRQAAAIAKDLTQRQKKADAAAKARERRETLLLNAADKLRSIIPLDLSQAAYLVRAEKSRIQDSQAFSVDDAIAAVVTAVESADFSDATTFAESVDRAAQGIIYLQESLDLPSQSPLPSSNGQTTPDESTLPGI